MLTKYVTAAMYDARYEILTDGTFYGEIPGFQGVYANAETLESCRDQLQEVFEDWIVLGLRLCHELPVVDGIGLTVKVMDESRISEIYSKFANEDRELAEEGIEEYLEVLRRNEGEISCQ